MYRTRTKISGHSTQKTEEVPGLGGKRKLTNATIDKLYNYYGIEINVMVYIMALLFVLPLENGME